MNKLQKNVRAIHMPSEARERVTARIRSGYRPAHRRSPAALAAVIALCLCLPVGVFAAGKAGFARDVKRWDGAVVGMTYENATEEISVDIRSAASRLTVTVTLLLPDQRPYWAIEELSIGKYELLDAEGDVIHKGGPTDSVRLDKGSAVFDLPTAGAKILRITEFIADAKAEQSLPIRGEWEAAIGN